MEIEHLTEGTSRTLEEIRQDFVDGGVSVAAWAIAHGFNPALVYQILRGQRKCIRGQCHRIAVRLGLKPNVEKRIGEVLAADKQP